MGRFQIFSPIPVPAPDKYCFNIISLKLVYQAFKLMSLRIQFIFTFCLQGLNLNILHDNYPFYVYKTKYLQNLKQGDFVKIFGQVKTSIDNNGKEHKNVRILSSKLLKAKEQVKSQDKDKKSILGQIKSFKTDDKTKSTKKDHNKGAER